MSPITRLDVPHIPPPADVAEPPADAVDVNGVFSKVLTPGTGQAHPSGADAVTVHYTAWTTDGATYSDSRSRGTPAVWIVNQAMEGLSRAMPAMVAGEKRRLWIPPPYTHEWARVMLVFDVELLAIAPAPPPPALDEITSPPASAPRTASGLAYRILRPGSGTDHPKAMSTVTIHYTAWMAAPPAMFDDSVSRDAPLTAAVDTLMPGLAEALQRMVAGERTRFWIPAELAYTPPGPPRSALVFDVELLGIQRAAEGRPGDVRVQSNSPDASFVLVRPDGSTRTAKGPQTFADSVPGRYRIKPAPLRLYALGVVASPADMVLAPGGTVTITITYRPIIR